MEHEKNIAVTYEDNGNLYTDILTPSEIAKDRATLDRVREIRIIDTPGQTLQGRAAIEYLQQQP